MKRVFVNGYGSIGSRIAQFISGDKDIEVTGVGKYSPDEKVADAISRGFKVFVPKKKLESFSKFKVAGTIEDAVSNCDLVIDASPGGLGYVNKKEVYEPAKARAIFQGGEKITGDKAVAQFIFNSRVNYDKAFEKQFTMQGSCNVTGMGRIIQPLKERYGKRIKRMDATLLRRWADLEDSKTEIKDSIEWTRKPHHDEDVKSYMGADTPLFIRVFKVPTRQMHVHLMDIRFDGPAPSVSEITDLYKNEYGVATLYGVKGTKDIRDYAESINFNFKDTNMIHIHADLTEVQDDLVKLTYSDDQTGIVVPENHLLMQAMLFKRPREEAFKHTEELFHMAEKKRMLEEHFKKQ
ncbi:MAG TPA: type II glyceraldehyde-3-phosphate dehydrogenase [Candidatus Nitrosotalea sp.]|nr:type II glyceraldehyde-3-phosphate dehydrogenase [Candidatus Nitrosotalea sp.]